jgi:beta-lactamase class A
MSGFRVGDSALSRRLLNRRTLLAGAPALLSPGVAVAASPDFARIERQSGGKLGVFAVDTGTGRTLAWRADERFPFCSAFKAPLAAFVLSKVDRGELRLDQSVSYGAADVLSFYAPITRQHLAEGAMTVEALCAAAVDYSDNIAANLLLRETGGPAALTAWMRATGDTAFELSHNEPKLNLSRLGDAHDTTTPRAMASSLRRFALGDVLSPASRARFAGWLVANTTGGQRLRAGLPDGWRVGDKTGTWNEGWFSTVDIALVWPPGRAPWIVAGFVTDHASTAAGERALSHVGALVAEAFARG